MIDEGALEKLNKLPGDDKILVVRALTLIEETKERMRRRLGISLPYKMQLRSDCSELERIIGRFVRGKNTPKNRKELVFVTTRLKTCSENILNWKFDK